MFTSSSSLPFQGRRSGRRVVGRTPGRRRVRLGLECLEDRLTPSTLTIPVNNNSDMRSYGPTETYAQLQQHGFLFVTLRDAIDAANNSGGNNTYVITLQSKTTYNLTNLDNTTNGANGLPSIVSNVTIVGNGSTVEQGGSTPFRLFEVDGAGTLNLQNLTLTSGLAEGQGVAADGGAIYSSGTLSLTNVTVKSNEALGNLGSAGGGSGGDASGGGIYVAGGSALLIDDTLSGNTAKGGTGGTGAIASPGSGRGGDAAGGGLYVAAGSITLIDDTLSGNTADGGDGGNGENGYSNDIYELSIGQPGGNAGNGSGGGMVVAASSVSLTNVTIVGNLAEGAQGGHGGAGGQNDGGYANPGPGGVGGSGGNGSGGGVVVVSGTTIHLTNTLIAQNRLVGGSGGQGGSGSPGGETGTKGGTSGPDVSGTVNSSDHDLIGNTSGFSATTSAGDVLNPASAKVNGLGGNGGPTQTMSLQSGSPAIDAGDTTAAIGSTDQRGEARIVGAAVDIGAYEFGAAAGKVDLNIGGSSPATAASGGTVTYTLSVLNSGTTAQSDVIVSDELPAGTTLVSWTPAAGWRSAAPAVGGSGGEVSAWIASLAAGESETFTLVVRVESGTLGNTVISDTAAVGPVTGDPLPNNNTVSFNTTVQAVPTTTAVTTSVAHPTYGTPVTFTAQVASTATPTGSLTFVIDGGAPVAGIVGATTATTATWTFTTSTLSAGTHTVQALFNGTDLVFADSNGTLSGGQVVSKANATIIVTPYKVPFDGRAHSATVAEILGVDGQTGATVGTVTLNTTHTNAGTYASDTWSFAGTANYNSIASKTITDTIAKANAAVVVTPYTVTYNGVAHQATVTSIKGVDGQTGATVGAVTLKTTHTAAGTYTTDSWTFTGGVNYNSIASTTITDTIAKANATVVVTPYTVTYNGVAHTATVTSIKGVDGQTGATVGAVTLKTTHTAAGTYATDSWSFTGGANYNSIASKTITDTINKANATVVVTPYTVTYNGVAHTATVTSIKGVDGQTGATVGAVTLNTTHTAAGTYATDSWSFAGTANYNSIASKTITDTINKANATVVVTPYTVTYNGVAHTATVASITGVDGQKGATVGTVTLNTTHTAAGTYAADSWSLAGTANYNSIPKTTITDTINEAIPTVTVTDVGGTFNGNPFPATATAVGLDGVTPVAGSFAFVYYAGPNTGGTLLGFDGPIGVGTYTVLATFVSTNPNFALVQVATTFSITQAAPTVAVSDAGGMFNGNPFPATATAVGVDGVTAVAGTFAFTYYDGVGTGGTNLGSTPPTGVGEYTVVADFASSDADYSNGSAQTTFSITQAAPTVSVSDAGGMFSGNPFSATATAVGVDGVTAVAGSIAFTYYEGVGTGGTDLGSTPPTGVGAYTVVANFTSTDPDYGNGSVETTFVISPAAPTVSVTDAGGTSDGSQFPATATAVGVDGLTPVSGSFSFAYYTGSTSDGTSSTTAPTGPGTYTVVVTFTSTDPNYSGGSAQTTFVVS